MLIFHDGLDVGLDSWRWRGREKSFHMHGSHYSVLLCSLHYDSGLCSSLTIATHVVSGTVSEWSRASGEKEEEEKIKIEIPSFSQQVEPSAEQRREEKILNYENFQLRSERLSRLEIQLYRWKKGKTLH